MIVRFTGQILCKKTNKQSKSNGGFYNYLTEGKWYQVIPYRVETTAHQLGGPNNGKMITTVETKDDCFHVMDDDGNRHCFFWAPDENSARSYLMWFEPYTYHRSVKIDLITQDGD